MSWIRNSPLRGSFGIGRRPISSSPPKDCDPTACFNSFREHWLQTSTIINKTQPPASFPIQDDVLAVVNHLDHMVTLLLLELRVSMAADTAHLPLAQSRHQCLDFLLCENLLERLFDWSVHTGRYCNLVRAEQLKLYELLACQARGQQLLLHQPFLRPLLRLLASCLGEVFPKEVEDRLVVLLNQLCVCLMHNTELLQLFFHASAPDQGPARFIIFSLLIPFVHREGPVGQHARDALLLCMTLAKQHEDVGRYIAQESNVCPVLATGLSGLYSRLPRKLPVQTDDWCRLTGEDVKDIEELMTFKNSFEFCNAVAQGTHPDVRQQLLDFISQGFLVPVLGPALLQSTNEELVAATAYLELCLRCATEPGLLRVLVRFLLRDTFDEERILPQLVQRLRSTTRLGLVSLALFNTLVGLCCEDVMLELALRPLVPCTHVMLSQRRRVRERHAYARSAEKFLSLAPACCHATFATRLPPPPQPTSVPPVGTDLHQLTPLELQVQSMPGPGTGRGRGWVSLYGNYHAYLRAARSSVETTATACRHWTYRYDGEDPPHDSTLVVTGMAMLGSGGEDGSSGYASLAPCPDDEESAAKPSPPVFHANPDLGPFLEALLWRLENFHRNNLAVNLQLTGLISRLACFPQPLLHSFLLNQSLVFQPSIRSLFQVLSTLKHKTDEYLARHNGVDELVLQSQDFLVGREEKLINSRINAQDALSVSNSNRHPNGSEPFSRAEPKRRSFSLALSSVFRRATQPALAAPSIRESCLERSGDSVRFITRKRLPNGVGSASQVQLQQVVLQAVLLDEWLKELAAITQEQALAGDSLEI